MYNQNTDGRIRYRCTDINKCRITNWKQRSKHRADWQKDIKKAKVSIGLKCHRRRRRRRRRRKRRRKKKKKNKRR
jgi:hypothetical protein